LDKEISIKNIADSRAQCDSMVSFLLVII